MSYFLHFKITSTLLSNREYIISSKTPFNGTNFYKTQKYVLLTRQYVIANVKYTKQNCILINFNKHNLLITYVSNKF